MYETRHRLGYAIRILWQLPKRQTDYSLFFLQEDDRLRGKQNERNPAIMPRLWSKELLVVKPQRKDNRNQYYLPTLS